MKESEVEKHLIKRVRQLGGKTAKFVSPEENGHPDRLVKLPGVPAFLVEVKRPREEPEPLQYQRLEEWQAVGMDAVWANCKADVELILGKAVRRG